MVHSHQSWGRQRGRGSQWLAQNRPEVQAPRHTKMQPELNIHFGLMEQCFCCVLCQAHSNRQGGCAHDVYWRKRYLIHAFKTFWSPLLLPSVRVQRERALRWRSIQRFCYNSAPFACQRGSGSMRERDLVAKDGKNMLAGRLRVVRGSLRNGGKENYFQKTSWEQPFFDAMFCVHWALLCKYQLIQIPK